MSSGYKIPWHEFTDLFRLLSVPNIPVGYNRTKGFRYITRHLTILSPSNPKPTRNGKETERWARARWYALKDLVFHHIFTPYHHLHVVVPSPRYVRVKLSRRSVLGSLKHDVYIWLKIPKRVTRKRCERFFAMRGKKRDEMVSRRRVKELSIKWSKDSRKKVHKYRSVVNTHHRPNHHLHWTKEGHKQQRNGSPCVKWQRTVFLKPEKMGRWWQWS